VPAGVAEANRASISPLAGKPAPKTLLVDQTRLEREYYDRKPDPGDFSQPVSCGTSGHRGSPLHGSFNEARIMAVAQAICEFRRGQGIDGPLFMGKDTHGVSGPAQRTAELPTPPRYASPLRGTTTRSSSACASAS
jgi:phosphoglucomutase